MVDGYDTALLLAVEGRHMDDSPETRANLLATIERSPDAVGVIHSATSGFVDLAVTPDGRSLLVSSDGDGNGVNVYDVATRQRRHAAATQAKPIHVALAADGRLTVHTDSKGTLNTNEFEYLLRVFDPETLADIGPPLGGVQGVDGLTRLSISADGALVGAVTDLEVEGGIASPPWRSSGTSREARVRCSATPSMASAAVTWS